MRFRLSLSLAGAAALTALVAAQSAQQIPIIRAKLELIQVDVTVLGPDGRPWRGLTIDDFELLDEGVPQTIRGFAEINIPDASDGPAWLADSAPDVRTASDGRVLIFVLDDAQIRYDRGQDKDNIAAMHRIITKVIDQMGPTDVAAVICTYNTACAQDFTADRNRLRAAVAKFVPRASDTGGGMGSWQLDWGRQTAGVTEKVVEYLIEQPGRRKSLIYVSPNVPIRPRIWPPIACPAENCTRLEEAVTQDQVMRAFADAYKSKVTVYGINPRGMQLLAGDQGDQIDDPGALRLQRPERSLATETGGFIVQGADQLSEGIAQIFRESGSYYLLGYEQPNHPVGRPHQVENSRNLEIRVKREGAVVRNKAGYVPVGPPKPSSRKPPSASDAALAGILPKTDLPLRVSVAPFAIPGRDEATVVVTLGVSQPAAESRVRELLQVQMRAFTQRGEARGAKREQFDATIATSREASVFEIASEMRLRPGVYALRFAVTSDRLGTTGSVYADVDVPDFARAPLSLSGVIVRSVLGKKPMRSKDAGPSVPADATTQREFGARDSVEAWVRVYQGAKPAAASMRVVILNAENHSKHDSTTEIAPSQFNANHAFDYRFAIPLESLSPGLHLLRFEATANGRTVRRDVQFVRR